LVVKKGLEDAVHDLARHAVPRIGHLDQDVVARRHVRVLRNVVCIELPLRGVMPRRPPFGIASRVGGEVGDARLELRGVGDDGRQIRVELQRDRDVLAERASTALPCGRPAR
jgi:hypothetical protein